MKTVYIGNRKSKEKTPWQCSLIVFSPFYCPYFTIPGEPSSCNFFNKRLQKYHTLQVPCLVRSFAHKARITQRNKSKGGKKKQQYLCCYEVFLKDDGVKKSRRKSPSGEPIRSTEKLFLRHRGSSKKRELLLKTWLKTPLNVYSETWRYLVRLGATWRDLAQLRATWRTWEGNQLSKYLVRWRLSGNFQ